MLLVDGQARKEAEQVTWSLPVVLGVGDLWEEPWRLSLSIQRFIGFLIFFSLFSLLKLCLH